MIEAGFNAPAARFALASLAARLLPGPRRVRTRVSTVHERDAATQAQLLVEQLALLDRAGVDGAFIMSFSFPLATYDQDPGYDLDATSLSLVRAPPRGELGTTYPDMSWEPKEAFRAVADHYRTR
jgi:hypothetical protein